MRVAFTGHRPEKLGGYADENPVRLRVKAALTAALKVLRLEHGSVLTAISGMALGVDQWAAEVCLDLHVPFIAAIPFVGQEGVWLRASRLRYEQLLAQAAERVVVSDGGYALYKLQKRNEWMVDHYDQLLAVWDGTPGGTANCVRYAEG